MAFSQFSRAYNSFSGVDIKAVFYNTVIGNIQAISYNVTREKAPIYTMGSADPRSFSRGKRGIAGALIFIVFDNHGLLDLMRQLKVYFLSDKDDVRPDFTQAFTTAISSAVLTSANPNAPLGSVSAESQLTDISSDQELALPWYTDQIPPFDITLAANNEYGASAKMQVFGVEIMNEGSGFSVDDIVVEQQMTYVARAILPWTRVGTQFVQLVGNPAGSGTST